MVPEEFVVDLSHEECRTLGVAAANVIAVEPGPARLYVALGVGGGQLSFAGWANAGRHAIPITNIPDPKDFTYLFICDPFVNTAMT